MLDWMVFETAPAWIFRTSAALLITKGLGPRLPPMVTIPAPAIIVVAPEPAVRVSAPALACSVMVPLLAVAVRLAWPVRVRLVTLAGALKLTLDRMVLETAPGW